MIPFGNTKPFPFTRKLSFPSPAVVNGVVYFGCDDDRLYAVSTTTHQAIWVSDRVSPPGDYFILSSPAVADGVVYVGSTDGNVYAFDATKGGKLLWTYTTNPSSPISFSSPAVAYGAVYIVDQNATVHAVSTSVPHSLLWKCTTGGSGTFFGYSSPAVANGVVYVGARDGLYAIDAVRGCDSKGKPLWKFQTGDGVDSSPVVANGVVYVGSYDGKFYALDAAKGPPALFTWHTGSVNTSAAVADGVAYVGTFGGYFYAFHLPDGMSPSPAERPEPDLLQPDWSLQPGTPVTSVPNTSWQGVE